MYVCIASVLITHLISMHIKYMILDISLLYCRKFTSFYRTQCTFFCWNIRKNCHPMDDWTNNDLQNNTQKTKDWVIWTSINTRGEPRCSGRVSSSCTHRKFSHNFKCIKVKFDIMLLINDNALMNLNVCEEGLLSSHTTKLSNQNKVFIWYSVLNLLFFYQYE